MKREAIYVIEKKEKIDKIKKNYNNMNMSDETAQKINRLNITNNILKITTALVGLVSVVNWFTPDPIPFIDEAILTGLTTLLGSASKIVENNIDNISKNGKVEIKIEEIQKLANQAHQIASITKSKSATKSKSNILSK